MGSSGSTTQYKEYKAYSKSILGVMLGVFGVYIVFYMILFYKKCVAKTLDREALCTRVLLGIVKTIQHETFPSMTMYILGIYAMSCELSVLILFLIGLLGQAVTVLGNIQRADKSNNRGIKFFKLTGRAIAHGTTVIMLVMLLNSLFTAIEPINA